MKAAILIEQNKPLDVDEVQVPELTVGQVLVKTSYSGICGKQLEEISGKRGPDPYLPHLLGHEGAGVVEKVGPGVRKVKPKDHVVMHWMKGSGIDATPPRFSRNGATVSAGWVTTLNEFTVASENRVTPVSTDLSLDVASLLGCAVTTGLGIAFNNAQLLPGQSIAVFGIGGVGLNVLQGASLVNAFPIVAIDIYDHKLKQAQQFGATHVFNSSNGDVKSFLNEVSGSDGFDATVDITGNQIVRELAYNVTSNTGKTILAGVPHYQEKVTLDSFPLHFGRQIFGSHGGDTNPDADIPRYARLYKQGKLKLDEQITHRFRLDDINEAIKVVQTGQAGRCIISMDSSSSA